MTKRKSDFTLPTLDDLFTTQEERDDAKLERVKNIPLDELHPFKNHPFKILNNEEMERKCTASDFCRMERTMPASYNRLVGVGLSCDVQ